MVSTARKLEPRIDEVEFVTFSATRTLKGAAPNCGTRERDLAHYQPGFYICVSRWALDDDGISRFVMHCRIVLVATLRP